MGFYVEKIILYEIVIVENEENKKICDVVVVFCFMYFSFFFFSCEDECL